MNFLQNLFQKQPIEQKKAPKKIIPFRPTTFYGLTEPAPLDQAQQIKAYSSWVFAAVNSIKNKVAAIDLVLKKKKSGQETEIIEEHEILNLLARVNNSQTQYDLFEFTSLLLELSGECFWWKMPAENGNVAQIFPFFEPPNMEIVLGKGGYELIKGYVYRIPGTQEKITFDAKEIIFFKYINPNNYVRGISPVKAAEFAIASDKEASKWNWRFFKNSAMPKGALEMDGTLNQEQYDRLKSQWDTGHGGEANAHKLAILEQGMKFTEIGVSQKDMDFLALKEFSRDEVLGMFGVPKTILGLTENVNRATAFAAKSVFIEETIIPKMRKIVGMLNEFLLPDFGDALFLDFKDPTPVDREITLKEYENGFKNGWLSPNEIRAKEGLQPYTGGENIFAPFNIMPIGQSESKMKVLELGMMKMQKQTIKDKIKAEIDRSGILEKLKPENKKKIKKLRLREKENRFSEIFEELFWKGIILRTDQEEKIFKRQLIKDFNRQEKQVLNSLVEKAFKQAINFKFDPELEAGIMIKNFEPIVKQLIKDHGDEIMVFLGAQEFNFTSAQVADYIKNVGLKFTKTINQNTKKEISKAIADGVELGESFPKIIKRVKSVFTRASTTRAFKIARTEVARSSNFSLVEGYKQSGFVTGKKWVTARDERVCPYCRPMNGKIISLNKNYFKQGDSFMGEASTPIQLNYSDVDEPPLHTTCRCTVLPVLPEKQFKQINNLNKLKNHNINIKENIEVKTKSEYEEKIYNLLQENKEFQKQLPQKIKEEIDKIKELELAEMKKLKQAIDQELYEGEIKEN